MRTMAVVLSAATLAGVGLATPAASRRLTVTQARATLRRDGAAVKPTLLTWQTTARRATATTTGLVLWDAARPLVRTLGRYQTQLRRTLWPLRAEASALRFATAVGHFRAALALVLWAHRAPRAWQRLYAATEGRFVQTATALGRALGLG